MHRGVVPGAGADRGTGRVDRTWADGAGATTRATAVVEPPGDRSPGPRDGRDPRRVVVGDPSGGGAGADERRTGAGPGRRAGGRRKRSRWQRLVLAAGAIVVVVCLLGLTAAGYMLVKYGSIARVEDLGGLPGAASGEAENYLMVAVDGRDGLETKNTDTIMVLRVDPASDRLALISFPRDLIVTIADTGESGMINSAFARDARGEKNLIDTLQLNYGLTINHYVQVNFESFRQVVDAVGGVPMWMPVAARDKASGFYNEQLGCVNLDGQQGLAFVRSRKLDIMVDGEWERDPLSDLSRVQRQQIFIQRAMADALSEVKGNPLRLRELVDIGVGNVALDPNLGLGDIVDLAHRFQGFDPAKLETYALPTLDHPQQPGRLVTDESRAEPMLNVFRGLPPGEISPGLVRVQVLNGTQADPARKIPNLATDVSGALQQVGFDMATPGDSDTFHAQTVIEHAPGQAAYAQRVARHIVSPTAVPTRENPDLAPGEVRLIAGADFTKVHREPTPIEAMPTPAGSPASAGSPAPAGGTGDATPPTTAPPSPSTSVPPPPTTHPANPYVFGAPPASSSC